MDSEEMGGKACCVQVMGWRSGGYLYRIVDKEWLDTMQAEVP